MPYQLRVFPIPLHGPSQPVVKIRLRLESEFLPGPAYVETSSGLAVGLTRIPHDPAGKSCETPDLGGKIADGHLFAASDIHGLGAVKPQGRQNYGLGSIVDI